MRSLRQPEWEFPSTFVRDKVVGKGGTELSGPSRAPAGSLELAMTHPEFYWYVDEGLSADNLKSSLLRSEILFGAPLPNYYSVDDRWEEQRAKFQSFVVTYVAMLAKQSTR